MELLNITRTPRTNLGISFFIRDIQLKRTYKSSDNPQAVSKFICYLINNYFDPKNARYKYCNWTYFYLIKDNPYYILNSNTIEGFNRGLKSKVPDGFFTIKKIGDVIRSFHLKKIEDFSSKYLGSHPLSIMRPEIRTRMTKIRELILEFNSIMGYDRLKKQWTVHYCYELGTITYSELQKNKFFETLTFEPNLIENNPECQDSFENSYLPSFIQTPCKSLNLTNTIPELENLFPN